MATYTQLARCKDVRKYDPELGSHGLPERMIYVSKKVEKWVSEELPEAEAFWGTEISPLEQLVEEFDAFCRGDELAVEYDFRCLRPAADGVWELKTPDLRVFGWFPLKNCFVAVVGHLANHVKKHNLYLGLIGEVVRFREVLPIDPPKFISGDDPDVIVSNYNQP